MYRLTTIVFAFSMVTTQAASLDPAILPLFFRAIYADDTAFVVAFHCQNNSDIVSDVPPDISDATHKYITLLLHALNTENHEELMRGLRIEDPDFAHHIESPLFVTSLLKENPAYANTVHPSGDSPLMLAISSYRNYNTRILIETPGINLNFKHSATLKSALHHAVSYGNVYAVALLCVHGADPNITSYFGQTPLHVAAMKEDSEENSKIIDILLFFNAEKTQKCHGGRTPYDIAQKQYCRMLHKKTAAKLALTRE